MDRRRSGGASCPGRVRTAFFPRRSALRRSSDRWETASRWAAVVVMVLLVPMVLALGTARAQQVRDQAASLRATSHPVQGTVVGVTRSAGEEAAPVVTVSWTESDGSVHVAQRTAYELPRGLGAPYPLWVDRELRPVPSPPTEQDAVLQGFVADLGGFTGSVAVLLCVLGLERRLLDRHRLRQWDEDWLTFRRRRDRGAAG